MNFLELVKSRYSCRAYKSLGVEKEKLDYILECVRLHHQQSINSLGDSMSSAVRTRRQNFSSAITVIGSRLLRCISLPLSCTMKNGFVAMASIMATSTLPLPWSTSVWLQRSKNWLRAGYAISMPPCAKNCSPCRRMRSLQSLFLWAMLLMR